MKTHFLLVASAFPVLAWAQPVIEYADMQVLGNAYDVYVVTDVGGFRAARVVMR